MRERITWICPGSLGPAIRALQEELVRALSALGMAVPQGVEWDDEHRLGYFGPLTSAMVVRIWSKLRQRADDKISDDFAATLRNEQRTEHIDLQAAYVRALEGATTPTFIVYPNQKVERYGPVR